MKDMQATATKVFITASIVFGVVGILIMLLAPSDSDPPAWVMRTLGAIGFVVLSSFGVSVGLKYLSNDK